MPYVKIRLGQVVEARDYYPELTVESRTRMNRLANELDLTADDWVRFAIELALANPAQVRAAVERERAEILERDRQKIP